jgi:Wax ester synthase-like Acyl-CoA acyltransferase domain
MVRIVGFEQGEDNDLIERATPIDMMELASDVGPVPLQVAAVLVFESGALLMASQVREALADRVCGIPRLRQQLVPAPPGCGRPVWVDDPGFDITRHFRDVRCPPPGDQETLLGVAAGVVTDPLPPAATLTARTALMVHSFEVNQWLLWTKPDSTWAWRLTPAGDGGTRLVTRIHAVYDWQHPLMALLGMLLMEFGDFAMLRRMLRGIKARAESLAQDASRPGLSA